MNSDAGEVCTGITLAQHKNFDIGSRIAMLRYRFYLCAKPIMTFHSDSDGNPRDKNPTLFIFLISNSKTKRDTASHTHT